MRKQKYNWIRYWYWRDGLEPPIQNGLLYRSREHAEALLFEITDLLEIPCLVLLGEPGMGKSYALEDAWAKLSVDEKEDRYSFFDLADFDTGSELVQGVISENIDFVEWQAGGYCLHLFLDSLDEAALQIKAVSKRILESIKRNKANLNRLRLRITCRTSDWPAEFEDQLKQLWGEELVRVFVLAPLEMQDVLHAAQQSDLDVSLFQEQLSQKEAWPFAGRPITLNFLINEFQTFGELPRTRSQLYLRGCEALCREINVTHAERSKLESEERLVVAARVAACMVLTGRFSIAIDGTNVLTMQDCSGGKELINDLELFVYESSVREALDTALFQGGETRQWAHQTYAEFLAAWYAVNVLDIAQIKNLIFHPDGQLIPQLRETAAWMANLSNEIFSAILETDPEVLLHSDVATADAESKRELTHAILKRCETEPHFLSDWSRLGVLKYPELAQDLKPYIEDKHSSADVRELAVFCAMECEESTLHDVIAYSGENDHFFRLMAITQTGQWRSPGPGQSDQAAGRRWKRDHTVNWGLLTMVNGLSS